MIQYDGHRHLRCAIAATLIAQRGDKYDGLMPRDSWMAGVAAEALRFARIILDVDEDMERHFNPPNAGDKGQCPGKEDQ